MRPNRLLSLIATLVAVTSAALVSVDLAGACSCAGLSPAERLGSDEPAVIGEVLDKQAAESVGDPPYDVLYTYTVRVERAFNTDASGEIEIGGNTSGAACGFSWSIGQRVGAFLYKEDGRWATNSCNLVKPSKLEAAADEKPSSGGEGKPVPGQPATDKDRTLRARSGNRVVNGRARAAKNLGRLRAHPSGRIRLRLGKAARSVRFGFARPSGKRLGRMREAHSKVGHPTSWLVRLPRSLPAGTDRLLVAIDYGTTTAKVAVGLEKRCRDKPQAP